MDIVNKVKSLLLNKNMVVILSVFAGIIVLWYIYNNRLNSVIKPIRIPVATRDILETEQILAEDITYVEINTSFVKKANIVTSGGALSNKFVANGTSIKEGSPFYREQVVDKADLRERDLEEIPDGNTLYFLKVDFDSTFANSIYPGDRIDLWIKMRNSATDNKFVYEPFITSIEVLKVKDSSLKYNVFDGSGKRTPSYLVFSVDKDVYTMLSNIEKLGSMELFPVPKNKMYTDQQAKTEYANDRLKTIVESFVRTYK